MQGRRRKKMKISEKRKNTGQARKRTWKRKKENLKTRERKKKPVWSKFRKKKNFSMSNRIHTHLYSSVHASGLAVIYGN